jgi:hypothetical protein
LDKHDRQIGAILKLVQTGMKMLVDNQRLLAETRRETHKELKALAEAQKRTEATLQAFIDSMRRGGNGHKKSNGLN